MRNDRRRPARPGRAQPGKPAQKKGAGKGAAKGTQPKKAQPKKKQPAWDAPRPEPEQPRTFRLGVIPGATPGKWLDAWKNRMPLVDIELVSMSVATQRDHLEPDAAEPVDAAIVRLPSSDADALHVIPLYEEVPVVVAASDSFLLATDHLTADDLAGQVLITPADDVLGPLELPTIEPAFGRIASTEDAIATVASGVGIAIVPMSLARLHHRKDVDYRPLLDGPKAPVGLAWRRDATTPDVDAFIGIVRGRTANSSR